MLAVRKKLFDLCYWKPGSHECNDVQIAEKKSGLVFLNVNIFLKRI